MIEMTYEQQMKKVEEIMKSKGVEPKGEAEHSITFEELIEGAKQGKYSQIFMGNIQCFVESVGCCSKCALKLIKQLREKGVTIHFLEEELDTMNEHNDFIITVLVNKAVNEMVKERKCNNGKRN